MCWCRKPVPGLGVMLMKEYDLDPALTTFVGDQKTDETFANRCGMKFVYAEEFFK